MKIIFKGSYQFRVSYLLRRCGYGQILDRKTGKTSFVRRLGANLYPRFHVYSVEKENENEITIHLDQKHASYSGHTAHSGECEGELVEQEAQRIKTIIHQYQI